MKVAVAVLWLTAALFVLRAPANALTESCPARLASQAVSQTAKNAQGPATLFGFELTAYGPRTVSATLEFDTDRGWFSVDVPAVALIEKDRHYSVGFAHDTVRDWISPAMYARFPSPVTVHHSWVFSAAAIGDGDFGWEKLGRVACSPPTPSMETAYALRTISYPASLRGGGGGTRSPVVLDSTDQDNIAQTPDAASRVFSAVTSRPTEKSDCDKPFAEASARQIVAPAFPTAMTIASFPGTVGLRIALNADGSLADAWVWVPSGTKVYDDAALPAIRQSTYVGAVAYCHPVPSQYNAFIFFDPG